MRSFLPWLAATLATTVASYSFPQLHVNTPRQVGEPSGPKSETPSNGNFSEVPLDQATFEHTNFGTTSTKLVFAINIHPSSGDIKFRMGGPNIYSWVAFGTGSKMQGSLMFVMYRSGHSDGMILSARVATGQHEPSHNTSINLASVIPQVGDFNNTVNSNGMFYQTGVCKGCLNIAPNKLDPNSTAQPFIFAVGPRNDDYSSDKADAPLRRHWYYGNFELDLSSAHGNGIPSLQFNATAKEVPGETAKRDPNFAESAHVFVMILTFVVVMPLGIFFIRSLEKVKIHMVIQAIALLLVIVGFATGSIISKLYNRSQNFNSAHQVIGILVFIFILAQWAFGFVSHRRYLKTGFSIKWMMQAHKLALGPIVFALGILNAALGFKLAQANRRNYVYLPAIFVVVVLLAVTSYYKPWFMARWGGANNRGATSRTYNNGPYGPQHQNSSGLAPGGYETGPYAANTRSDIALSPMGDPPAYEAKPERPREFA